MITVTRRSRLGAGLLCLLFSIGCASASIPRSDWGAITPEAAITVVTKAGVRYDVAEVVVYEDVLEGTIGGGFALVSVPLDSIARITPDDRSAFRVITAAAVLAATLGIVQAITKGDIREGG